MKFHATPLADLTVIETTPIADDRGQFSRVFCAAECAVLRPGLHWVQINVSRTYHKGTVRGLHFQVEPFAQAKLVRAIRGALFDVALDIRRGSPTFGRHVAVTLTAELGNQLFIPVGFAHGYCTLEPRTEIAYKVTRPYAPECDRALYWADPALGIDWPVGPADAVLSEKDANAPALADAPELL